jgi:hypothetical protein
MKKTILILINCLLMFNCFSQEKPDLPVCLIFNGALTLSSMEKDDAYFTSSANPGFAVGAAIRSDGDIFLSGGLQYLTINPTITNTDIGVTDHVNAQYFQIPLMAGIHVLKSIDATKCAHVQLGGSFTTLLNVSDNDVGINKDNLKNNGIYVKGGIGTDLWRFVANINYNLLVTHFYDFAGYNNRTRLLCWEFSIGYKLNLEKKNHPEE